MRITYSTCERGRLFGFSHSALAIDFTTAASASRETEETGLAFNVQPHTCILFMHAVLLPSLPDRLCSCLARHRGVRRWHHTADGGRASSRWRLYFACLSMEIDDDELRREDVMRHRDRPAGQSHRAYAGGNTAAASANGCMRSATS